MIPHPHDNQEMTTRRSFLSRTGQSLVAAGIGGAVLAHSTARAQNSPAQPSEGKKIGYALVGLGKLTMGQLLPAFAQCRLSRPTALVSGDPDKAKKLADQYGIKHTYSYETYDQLKDNPDVDVIYIVLPNGMHAEYTIRGAKAGKHILCEKPMANTVAECRQMIDACDEAKRKLMIAYRLRYEPVNNAAIQMVRDKVMGPPRFIQADAAFVISAKGNPWRLNKKLAGGGALLDIGIYALNATRYLTGEEPVEVNALIHTPLNDPRFKEVEDMVAWQLKFPSGVLANSSTSYSTGANRFRVVGPRGYIEAEPFLSYSDLSLRKVVQGKSEAINVDQVNHFAAEMDHMSECVLSDKTPLTPGEEGLNDLKVIEAIYKAAESKQTVKI
jgi:predicted dehydrogenase